MTAKDGTLEDRLYEIEKKFWTEGGDYYRAHTAEKCLTMFPEMAGLIDRETIAKSAAGGRWKSVGFVRKGFLQPSENVAILSYEAGAGRADGKSYQALVSTGYARNSGDEWRMIFHQQTPIEPQPAV